MPCFLCQADVPRTLQGSLSFTWTERAAVDRPFVNWKLKDKLLKIPNLVSLPGAELIPQARVNKKTPDFRISSLLQERKYLIFFCFKSKHLVILS